MSGNLHASLRAEQPLSMVGVINAYAALQAQAAGFRAVYLSGAGVANALGAETIRRAPDFDSPLRIYRSPWRLLLASNEDEFVTINGSPGAVILNDDLSPTGQAWRVSPS